MTLHWLDTLTPEQRAQVLATRRALLRMKARVRVARAAARAAATIHQEDRWTRP